MSRTFAMAGGSLRTFRIGTPRAPDEGLRIAVTRRPPRGIPKSRWCSDALFDVWFPALAPSEALIRRFRPDIDDAKARGKFFAAYERELRRSAESRAMLELLVALAQRTPLSIGCFCEDETRCHRSRLFEVLQAEAAKK